LFIVKKQLNEAVKNYSQFILKFVQEPSVLFRIISFSISIFDLTMTARTFLATLCFKHRNSICLKSLRS